MKLSNKDVLLTFESHNTDEKTRKKQPLWRITMCKIFVLNLRLIVRRT